MIFKGRFFKKTLFIFLFQYDMMKITKELFEKHLSEVAVC